jgi:hypothetical protein
MNLTRIYTIHYLNNILVWLENRKLLRKYPGKINDTWRWKKQVGNDALVTLKNSFEDRLLKNI